MKVPPFVRQTLLALLCAAAVPALARAQVGRIAGIVTDAQSGQPIEGVQVYLKGTGYGAVTRANGRYFLINVPPGQYTVAARRVGYQESQVENVTVLIDVLREVNFQLSSSASQLAAVKVQADQVPLLQPQMTGSSSAITTQDLQSLPVTDIAGALSLQAGFLASPQNTDVLSYTDVRRALTPVHIRGGRATETTTLIDGIPVNNFLFGGPALDISKDAVQQIDYIRGGFEPQYGNALSGIINIAVKEGTTDLHGSVEAQSSGVGGALGSTYDDKRDYQQIQGYISGSVPATNNRLRYMFSGRQHSGASRVLKFDNQIYNPLADIRDQNQDYQSVYDLIPGFRAFGFDDERDIIAKTSFYFTPVAKLNFTVIDYQRQSQPYAFDWVQTGFNEYAQCVQDYPNLQQTCSAIYNNGQTITSINDLQDTYNENWYVRQASTNQTRRLYVGSYNQTLGRVAISANVGQFVQHRNTCTYASGVCLGTRLAYTYINGPFVETGGRSRNDQVPLFGTEKITGSDETVTNVQRADVTWQATDHHNLQAGIFSQQHDVHFSEFTDVGLNRVVLNPSIFHAQPWDAAGYLQDRIEYDFLTLKLGARFDYGRAPGEFLANPRDPTNGTTAVDVCNNPTRFGVPADTFRAVNTEGDSVHALAACSANDPLMQYATKVAAKDDFKQAPTRKAFSPRIGIQFPLSERSSVFFNFGKFAQNPAMYDLYRGTGIGTPAEGTPAAVNIVTQAGSRALLGNPQLETETATSYEMGYATEFQTNYALTLTAFNKEQAGLSGVRTGGLRADGSRVSDPGGTYGVSNPDYDVIVNQDFQVVRGVEVSLRRRLANFWAADLNYSYSRCTTNADPPDQEEQKRQEGDVPAVQQIRCTVDQPQVLNGILRFQADQTAPPIPYLGRFLKYTSLTATIRMMSGLPYTPTVDFTGNVRQDRNSGTGPTDYFVDLYASKDWLVGNLKLGAFAYVNNLLDRRNCVQVFTSTGQCESGGMTIGRLENGRIGAGFGSTYTMSEAFDRPDYMYPPRSISGGLRISF